MDEPSTGLDPAARLDLWHYLRQACGQGMTVALTTHLLEEAEKADTLAILDRGRLVALDTPGNLRAGLGGDTITIAADDAAALTALISQRFGVAAQAIDGNVLLRHPEAAGLLGQLVQALGDKIRSITLGKPTLEDVFIERTGHRFWSAGE
jgi:ABC-2 type transport system ATP-binding protein